LKNLNRCFKFESFYFITVSLIGLLFLILMIFAFPTSKLEFYFQKPIIFLIFVLICFCGILAGIFPQKCLKLMPSDYSHNKRLEKLKREKISVKFQGHHPNCGNFSNHIIHLNNQIICAGCTGLVIGAIISLLATFIFLIYGSIFTENGLLIFWLGYTGASLGLLSQIFLNININYVKLFTNLILVLGTFLLLVGIEKITNNLYIELYLLILALIWILMRINLSKTEHDKICSACQSKTCNLGI
jgi:hypothetical protein